jgi:hypothetical protein
MLHAYARTNAGLWATDMILTHIKRPANPACGMRAPTQAFELKTTSAETEELKDSGENIVVGGANRCCILQCCVLHTYIRLHVLHNTYFAYMYDTNVCILLRAAPPDVVMMIFRICMFM